MAAKSIRLATYNVENLFSRPRAMNQSVQVAAETLQAHARINELFEQETYSDANKLEILNLLRQLNLVRTDGDLNSTKTLAVLRRYRGQLLRRPKTGGEDAITVAATGRDDWTGWVDLVKERIDAKAIENTALVVKEVGADIVAVVEAEDRITLQRFSDSLLRTPRGVPLYPHVMVIDGNDARGIDVGIVATKQYPIDRIVSHVDDGPVGDRIFSRDCAEYWFTLPEGGPLGGQPLVLLINHLKSKFGGNDDDSIKRRKRQATQVAKIYDGLIRSGVEHVAVLGDFNDTPDSAPLQPLLAKTDLKDFAFVSPFDDGDPIGDRPGTFGNGTKSNKIDYLLLSPSLFVRATRAGIFRLGVWGGENGTLFPHFPSITKASEAASDHAAVYVDIDLR